VAKGEAEVYRPAEACRIAEVAPYVLRYWETEFPVLSDGKDKGSTKLYTARDVKMISRIRELLYDEGFTVAGAKKRLEAEIAEGRFDDGLAPAPPVAEQRKIDKIEKPASAPATRKADPPAVRPNLPAAKTDLPLIRAAAVAPRDLPVPPSAPAVARASDFDRRSVLRELKDIVRLLDRGRK
jgi:DNA-binding transcriptional MerR regulator